MMIHEKIRYLRDKRKIRQEDMAERLGVSQSAYSRMETGEARLDAKLLPQIAEVLEVGIEELLAVQAVFNVSNNSGGAYANYGHIGHLVPEEFVEKLMDRYDAKHEAQVKNLEAMNQRLLDLLEKKLG